MNEDALEKLKRMAMQRYTDRIKSGEKMPQISEETSEESSEESSEKASYSRFKLHENQGKRIVQQRAESATESILPPTKLMLGYGPDFVKKFFFGNAKIKVMKATKNDSRRDRRCVVFINRMLVYPP